MGIELKNVDFLIKQMNAFGPTVAQRAADAGIRGAARMAARDLKKAAPRGPSGNLRRAIKMKYSKKMKTAFIGLRSAPGERGVRFYYKTLEFQTKLGPPRNPFMEKEYESQSRKYAQYVIDNTTTALYEEAAKVYRRTVQQNNRR